MKIEDLIEKCSTDFAEIFDEQLKQVEPQEESVDVELTETLALSCLNAFSTQSQDAIDDKYEQLRSNNCDYIYDCENQIISDYLDRNLDISDDKQKNIILDFLSTAAKNGFIESEILGDLALPITEENEEQWIEVYSSFYKEFVEEQIKEQLLSRGYCLFDLDINLTGSIVLSKDCSVKIPFKDWEMQFTIKKEYWNAMEKEIDYPFLNCSLKEIDDMEEGSADCICVFMQFSVPNFEGVNESDWDSFFWNLGYESFNFKEDLNKRAQNLLKQLIFINQNSVTQIEQKQMFIEIDLFERFLNKTAKIKNGLEQICKGKQLSPQFKSMLMGGVESKNLLSLTPGEIEEFCNIFESEEITLSSFAEIRLEGEIGADDLDYLRRKKKTNQIVNTQNLSVVQMNNPMFSISASSVDSMSKTILLRSNVIVSSQDLQITDYYSYYSPENSYNNFGSLKAKDLDSFCSFSINFEKYFWGQIKTQKELEIYTKNLQNKVLTNISFLNENQIDYIKNSWESSLDDLILESSRNVSNIDVNLRRNGWCELVKVKDAINRVFTSAKLIKQESNKTVASKGLVVANKGKKQENTLDTCKSILDYLTINPFGGGIDKFLSECYMKELIKTPNVYDDLGRSALMLSVAQDNYEISKLLIENGADVFAKDKVGNDFLDYLMNNFNYSKTSSWRKHFSTFEPNDWLNMKNELKNDNIKNDSIFYGIDFLKLAKLNIQKALSTRASAESFLSKIVSSEQFLCILCLDLKIENQEVIKVIEKRWGEENQFMAAFERLYFEEEISIDSKQNKKEPILRL